MLKQHLYIQRKDLAKEYYKILGRRAKKKSKRPNLNFGLIK